MYTFRSAISGMSETAVLQLMMLLRQLSMIILAVFFSRNYTLTNVGQVEGLQYILTSFSVFWLNGILQWFLPEYHRIGEDRRADLLWRVATLLFLLSLFVCLVINNFRPSVFHFFLQSDPFEFLDIFLLYALMMLPSYFLEYALFAKGKYRLIIIISVLTLLIQNLPVFFKADLSFVFGSWAFLACLRFLHLLYELLPLQAVSFAKLKSTLLFSLPLILYALISQWAATYNSWLVNFLNNGDVYQFAIFRYGARELPVALALATGLSAAMSAAISRNFDEGILLLKQKSARLMHLLFPFTLILLIGSNWWFPLVFSRNLSGAVLIFDIFLLLIVSRLLFPQSVALALNANRALMWISVSELLVNMVTSLLLAKAFGLAGIALGTLIAYIFEKVIIAVWLQWRYAVRFGSYTPWKWYFSYSCLSILVFGLKYTFLQTLFVQ